MEANLQSQITLIHLINTDIDPLIKASAIVFIVLENGIPLYRNIKTTTSSELQS